MHDRLISGKEKPEDQFDRAIRPTSLADYIGQPVVLRQIIGRGQPVPPAADDDCIKVFSHL